MESLEEILKKELNLKSMECIGSSDKGYISKNISYTTDQGQIFVKVCQKPEAREMFVSEMAGLEEFGKLDIVKVPKPLKIIKLEENNKAAFVIEYCNLTGPLSTSAGQFGQQIANIHLHNSRIKEKIRKEEKFVGRSTGNIEYVDQFGFSAPTYNGYFIQSNEWCSNWLKFYCNKVEHQIELFEKHFSNREVRELWNTITPNVSKLFKDVEITPALLHGDLHLDNVGESSDGPVLYDPAVFYGHNEYDLVLTHMFDRFPEEFYTEYHKIIPKTTGYTDRLKLYQIYNYINHWNHFGEKYRVKSLDALKYVSQIVNE